jgi:ribosomal-protein-serine acetyltransferase
MFSHRVDEDIELRLSEERFAEEATAVVRDNLDHLKEWLPWVKDDYSVEDTLEFVRRNLQQFAANEGFSAQIVYRGRFAGNIGFNKIDWANRKTEVGYWIAAPFQGRGVVTRACRAFVGHAFDVLRLNRVEIYCGVGNAKSRRIPERLGFRQEGTLRQAEWLHDHFIDLVLYSMLAEDWEQRETVNAERRTMN